MRPRRFPEANVLLTLPGGNEDNFLYIRRFEDENMMLSCWELDAAEVAQVAAGERINLWVWGETHPVIAMTVGTEDVGAEDST